MQKDIGIGVIGLGMGVTLFPLNTDKGSRLAVRGVCSARPPERARGTLAPWGIDYYTNDFSELMRRPDIDAIGVYSPDDLHFEHCRGALEAGKHVICTKPLAANSREALELVKLVQKTHLKLLVAQTFRFEEQSSILRQLYDEGKLGRIIFAEANYIHDIREMYKITPWRLQKKWMIGAGCHPLDALRWFLGDVEEVHAYANCGGVSEYSSNENFVVNLKFKGEQIGKILLLMGCLHSPEPYLKLSIYGDKGSAGISHTDNEPGMLEHILDKSGAQGPLNRMIYPSQRGVDRYGHGETEIR
ncbi:MAG TPA: Gfo/Idh/MocA family oxidoreductase, partial [Spirochaetia bacterium]|nr:Gfo/Idh/MocA family oxidoreductase [Spirochaetia bacterium]